MVAVSQNLRATRINRMTAVRRSDLPAVTSAQPTQIPEPKPNLFDPLIHKSQDLSIPQPLPPFAQTPPHTPALKPSQHHQLTPYPSTSNKAQPRRDKPHPYSAPWPKTEIRSHLQRIPKGNSARNMEKRLIRTVARVSGQWF
jgi:hypothetical protein